jgi:hypothetical protein
VDVAVDRAGRGDGHGLGLLLSGEDRLAGVGRQCRAPTSDGST